MKLLLRQVFGWLLTGLLWSVPAVADTALALAPGYGKLGYELPRIGSYVLPVLGVAGDGKLLDERGGQVSLHSMLAGKYTLLNFIYSHCDDVNGCPLTANVFYKVKTAMRKDAQLADNLRLLTISFDPERDTPEVMRLYGENFKYAGNQGEWRFMTTASLSSLEPILEAYNQDIQRNASVNGSQTGNISHILRVFLIDPELKIRNIYSVGFLHSDLVINDLKTLLAGESTKPGPAGGLVQHISMPLSGALSRPGDDKQGYETSAYVTHSRALESRAGKGNAADLLAIVKHPPLGLPALDGATLSALSKEKIALGRALFYDRRLSLNKTFSCAMCHIPEQGFTSNELATAVGIEGRSVRRNTPTIYNVAYATRLFHDGRENSLEQQIWGPLLSKNEMGNPSVGYVVDSVRSISGYQRQFAQVFGDRGVNMLTIGEALAAYEKTLVSGDSPFDRWYYGKQADALTESARRGFELFTGRARCSSCHTIGVDYALLTDNQMHNTGIGYRSSMGRAPETRRMLVAPGVYVEIDSRMIEQVGEPAPADVGLYEVSENPDDRWKYKTPSLRNVALTAPYMHNGSLRTLAEVVDFYNRGGVANELLDPRIAPLGLSESEQRDLVAFLQSLTGANVELLVADAFAAPVGDITSQDRQQ